MGRLPARRNSLVVLALTFAGIFAVLEALIWGALASGWLDPLMASTAKGTAGLIRWFGIPVTLDGIRLTLANHILEIDLDCTAIQLAALYSALLLAYPVSTRTKLIGLAVGLPVIAAANMLRLLGVAFASENLGAALFAYSHDFLFKVAMMLVIVGLWSWWLQGTRRDAAEA